MMQALMVHAAEHLYKWVQF